METKFVQKDYVLSREDYKEVFSLFEKEIKKIEKSKKKTLWYYGAAETLKHLKEEKGNNLNPRDIDNITYVLLRQIEANEKKVKRN